MCDHEAKTLVVGKSMWRELFGDDGNAQYWICNECSAMDWTPPVGQPWRAPYYETPTEFKHSASQWLNRKKMNAVSHLGQAFGRPREEL